METEISIVLMHYNEERLYKVTRRTLELFIAETKLFRTRKEALLQVQEWTNTFIK